MSRAPRGHAHVCRSTRARPRVRMRRDRRRDRARRSDTRTVTAATTTLHKNVLHQPKQHSMSVAYVHTRTAAPRYEIRGAPGGNIPCSNVPHVVACLRHLDVNVTDPQVYAMVRKSATAAQSALRLPVGLSVHRLTADERTSLPVFRVTRTVEVVGCSDDEAVAV